MRIAQIVSTYPPYYAGMGNVVFQTAAELNRIGHDVVVFTPQYYEEKEIKQEGAFSEKEHNKTITEQIDFAKRLKPSLKYGNAARLPQLKKELDAFDIVHLHYPFFGTAELVKKWKEKNLKKPLVITYHMDNRGTGWKGLFFKFYSKYYMPKIFDSADKLIASSFDYIRASDAGFLYRQNSEKWIEIPFGVDTERFMPRKKPLELFERHNLDIDKPVLLFVGGMDYAHYFKGVSVLLEALLLLHKNDIDFQTVFVGEGELKKQFEIKTIGFGLKKSVRFVGKISNEELPFYYNMSDLFILPAINSGEAFGMVLLEAMASGIPVLASDLPGVRTVALDGGQVFPPKDPVSLAESILGYFNKENNKEFWRNETTRIVKEKYSWESVGRELEKIYQELMA